MNRLEHILTCVAEEGVEVSQRATKALRFGLNDVQPGQDLTNWDRLIEEFHDLFGVMVMLAEYSDQSIGDLIPLPEVVAAKRDRVVKFMGYAREQGALQ